MRINKVILDWNDYIKASRDVIAEGCVLLENNGALPLKKDQKISIFGRIQLNYYKSGTGSGGMVNVSSVEGIIEGLKEEGGPSINEELLNEYKLWEESHPFNKGTGWGTEPWSQEEMVLSDETVAKASEYSDTAIVIIGRTAGEDKDFFDTDGAYRLSSIEKEMMSKVRSKFKKMIVLLNIGQLMDLSFIDNYKPDATMIVWQGGMVGGLGTADVLMGKVNPSGKLTDTAAYEISDYPSTSNFGDPVSNNYVEDIYVGYRYFETFAKEKVRYPFGYGLSYTNFDIDAKVNVNNNNSFTVNGTVTNRGDVAGKEVFQVYVEAPYGKLGKASRVLADFKKTGLLVPGAKQDIELIIPFENIASFDDKNVTEYGYSFVLEEGEYKVYVGSDVRSASLVGSFSIEKTLLIEKLSHSLGPVKAFKRMKPIKDADSLKIDYEDVPLCDGKEEERRIANIPREIEADYTLTRSLKDVLSGSITMDQLIASFTDDDLACIVRGEGMGSSKVTAGTASAFGGVSEYLSKKDIPVLCCDDGPSGMRLDSGVKAFSLPSGAMIASTFNPEIIERLYSFEALEMISNKVDVLLGPGMNIHRNPLNGRNFEYFSEDPYVTGVIAKAMLSGLKKHGVSGCAKHFCGNNQELGRNDVDSCISERALREIYLKGFEYVVKKGVCDAIMTTYGQVNGRWTAGNPDLNTQILRKEWGFRGVVMTDWWAKVNYRDEAPDKNNTAAMVSAQNDLYMVVDESATNSSNDNTLESLQKGTLKKAELQRCAANICEVAMKSAAMKRLMKEAVEVEIINRPDEGDDFDLDNVEYIKLKNNLTMSLEDKPSVAGTNYYFPLDIEELGDYDITVTGSSLLSELAQVTCTLYYTGVPFLTYTFNGSNGKDVSITKTMDFHNRMGVFRLNVPVDGVELKSIEFKRSAVQSNKSNIRNH